MPAVSVIIPVYNTEAYLRKCIESVLNQTIREIEVILVDDGSTDSSGIICDKYKIIDERVQVIHKKNEGISSARNVGIKKASADYIMFIDSDDWVEPFFCEDPYRIAIQNEADIVIFPYYVLERNGSIKKSKQKLKSGRIEKEKALELNNESSYAWNKLYKKDLFKTIEFPFGKMYEDIGTTHKLIYNAKRLYYLDKPLYYYNSVRNNSVTRSFETDYTRDKYDMLWKRASDMEKWGYGSGYKVLTAWTYLVYEGRKGKNSKAYERTLFETKGIPTVFNSKQKLMFLVYKISPHFFDIICILTGRRRSNWRQQKTESKR